MDLFETYLGYDIWINIDTNGGIIKYIVYFDKMPHEYLSVGQAHSGISYSLLKQRQR